MTGVGGPGLSPDGAAPGAAPGAGRARRVAVVDDDDVTRTGTVALLARHPGIEVVAEMTHIDAVARPDWDGVDVAVVDASDRRRETDQFPGVGVVQAIRHRRDPTQTMILVLTGIMFDDAVRRRMREAGADYYVHRSAVMDAAQLCDAVMAPAGSGLVPEPCDAEALHRMGVTAVTDVNEAVRAATEEGLLGGDTALARRGRSRSQRRARFAERANLEARNADGRIPDREQETPGLPQIDRFLRWATRIRDGQRG